MTTTMTTTTPPRLVRAVLSAGVPLLVCLCLVPLVVLAALISGWHIWTWIPAPWRVPVHLQYGHGLAPYAHVSLPLLSTAQPYDLALHLVLPASDANVALGNFMASLSLSTPSNKSLVSVSRPAIVLPPKPAPFSFSATPRLVDLDVPLLSSYVPASATLNAHIVLGRSDAWKSLGNGEARELSVWAVALSGAVRPHGIRGLVSRFPLTVALLASAAFFSLSLFIMAACFLPAVRWPDQMPTASEPRQDRPVRIRKRSRRSVAAESRAVYKSEDIPLDMPSASQSDVLPLKRRRSRISDTLLDSEN